MRLSRSFLFFGLALALSLAVALPVAAQEASITFPIAELGGCESKDACHAYCEVPANQDQCLDFAEAHNLMDKGELERARKIGSQSGPGGCIGIACKTYCDDDAHIDECLAFAEEHDLIDADEIAIAREVRSKGGPGGCKSERECRAYCEAGGHEKECLEFAEKHNLMSKEELERAKKFIGQIGPGGCRGAECKTYCEDGAHIEECVDFAVKNGFMTEEQAAKAKKIGNKPGPGGCFGERCRIYCDDAAHQEECFQFAVENDLLSPEDQERLKQSNSIVGPGGCKGEECREYCEDIAHQEECLAFAKEHGIGLGRGGPQDGAERMGPGGCRGAEECRAYCADHTDECDNFRPGENPEHPTGQDRAIEQRGFEVPPGLLEDCRANPEACRQRFQREIEGQRNNPPIGDYERVLNMTEEERKQYIESERARRIGTDPRGSRDSGKPYQPEGLLPMEAFRSNTDHTGMTPTDPGAGASPEQRRVYEMNMERYQQYQANPQEFMPREDMQMQHDGQYQPGSMPPPQPQSMSGPGALLAAVANFLGLR